MFSSAKKLLHNNSKRLLLLAVGSTFIAVPFVCSKSVLAEEKNCVGEFKDILDTPFNPRQPDFKKMIERGRRLIIEEVSPNELEPFNRIRACAWLLTTIHFFPSDIGTNTKLITTRLLNETRARADINKAWSLASLDRKEMAKLSDEEKQGVVLCKLRIAWFTLEVSKIEQALKELSELPQTNIGFWECAYASILSYHLADWNKATFYSKRANELSPGAGMEAFYKTTGNTIFRPNYKNIAELAEDLQSGDSKHILNISRQDLQERSLEVVESHSNLVQVNPLSDDVKQFMNRWQRIPESMDIVLTGAVASWYKENTDLNFSGIANMKEGVMVMVANDVVKPNESTTCDLRGFLALHREKPSSDSWQGVMNVVTSCIEAEQEKEAPQTIEASSEIRMKLRVREKNEKI